MKLTRRNLLKLTGTTVAGLMLVNCGDRGRKHFSYKTPPEITAYTEQNVYQPGQDITLIVEAADPESGVKVIQVDWDRDGSYDAEKLAPAETEQFIQSGGRAISTIDTIDVYAENNDGYGVTESPSLRVLPYQFDDGGNDLDNLVNASIKEGIIGGKLTPAVWQDYVFSSLDQTAQQELREWEDAMNSSSIDQIIGIQYAVKDGNTYLIYEMGITDESAFDIDKFPGKTYVGVMEVTPTTATKIENIANNNLTPAEVYDVLIKSAPSNATFDETPAHLAVLLDQGVASFDFSLSYSIGTQPVDLHFNCPPTAQSEITSFNGNYHPPYVPLSAEELNPTNVFAVSEVMENLLTYHQQNNP